MIASIFHIFKIIYVLMRIFTWGIMVLFMGGRVPFWGLFCASVMGSHNIDLIRVSYFV